MASRLSGESSPYLREHARDPVDWYPWCDEAFEAAREQDKPVFLSIGYSSCHWCHRMENDCFMDEEVAELMNRSFINVLVDREERPDIDSHFMKLSFLMTGTAGWPLNMIMTYDLKPFFAASYIPKHSSYGIRGMMELIPMIVSLWRSRRNELLTYGNSLVELISRREQTDAGDCSRMALLELTSSFDREHGGFGKAPKFPSYCALMLLLCTGKADMVEKTLHEMFNGGIFDQLEYGFHRYSTDRSWGIPHFEKMLYDQSLSMLVYADAYRATGNEELARCVDLLVKYVNGRLLSREGGFFSSEDSDSEGEEGRYYMLTDAQISSLPTDLLEYAKRSMLIRFNEGYIMRGSRGAAEGERCLELLRKSREGRQRPKLDTKILTDWNSLAVASMAFAGSALGREDIIDEAKDVFEFLKRNMFVDGTLKHCFVEGRATVDAFLEDHAYMMWAALELYESTLEISYLKIAMELLELVNKNFKNESGPFYKNRAGSDPRVMETEDLVLPSGNSVMLYNMFRLYLITGSETIKGQYDQLESSMKSYACEQPSAHAFFYYVKKIYSQDPKRVILVGRLEEALKFVRKLHKLYAPEATAIFRDASNPLIDSISNFTQDYQDRTGSCTAYVCGNGYCSRPITSPEELVSYFKEKLSQQSL